MHPIATRIDLAPGLRLDLLTPTTFRLRRSCLQPDPFPEAYEVPFAMAGGTTWEPVPFTRAASCGCATIATEAIVIHISGESLIVEAAGSGRRIFPSLHPRHGLCRNGCMVFDAAGPPDAPTTCSRFSHWFHNPATGLHDIYLPGDDLHDLFFIYGPDYPALFRSFNRLVGPEPLLTRKGYGFYQTQHLGFIGNQQMLMRTVAEFRQRGIPLDTVILDFEWGDGSNGPTKAPWGSRLAWSSTYCSPLEPAAMIAELSRQHVEVMLIHHSIPDYPGRHDESWTCQASPADVWWKAMDEKLAQGVVGTWQDTRQSDITNHRIHAGIQQRLGDGRRAAFLGCHQVFLDCNWTHQTHPLPTQQRIGGRRVSFAWTGDKSNDRWSELRFQVEAIANRAGAMYGISHLCDDMMRCADWRLAIRSLQFHCLSTIARSHNMKPWQVTRSGNLDSDMAITNNGTGPDRRQAATCSDEEYLGLDQPHARQEELFRRFLGLRYRLMPYLYTLVHSGWRTGMPVCRPLIMAFPDDPACREDQFPAQYLLGEDLLVAPVVDPEPTMAVHLPLGHDWVDFFTGQCFTGGQTIRMATDDLDRLPLFVRQGAVIPMQPAATWIEHGRNPDPLELHLWPAAAGGCLLIEDDGISLGYQRGETADLAVSYRCDDGRCIIDLAPVRGSYRGMPASRTVTIHLHGVGAEPVTIVVPAAQGAQVAVPLAEYGDAGG